MLSLHAAQHRRTTGTAPRIGLAIAGGGPTGAMYELGALRALDEACDGLDLTRLDCYVGVSSGAFFAAGLANRMDTAELCRIFITGDSQDVVFRPACSTTPRSSASCATCSPAAAAATISAPWSARCS